MIDPAFPTDRFLSTNSNDPMKTIDSLLDIDTRPVVTAMLLAVMAGMFWIGSRYLELNEKVVMGSGDQPIVQSAEPAIRPGPGVHFIEPVAANRREPAFGVLFYRGSAVGVAAAR